MIFEPELETLPREQLRALQLERLRSHVIACTPSYALTLAQSLRERGVAPTEVSLRYALLGAEPWTEAMRSDIEQRVDIDAVISTGCQR